MHRTISTHRFFGTEKINTEKIVHTDCTRKNVPRLFCMQKLYPEQIVPSSNSSAQKPFRTDLLNAQQLLQTDGFYTESFPHRSLTHRRFYAQQFFTAAFIHRCLYTEDELHTETCAHSTLLHATSFYTERFCFPFLITYLSCSPSQVSFFSWSVARSYLRSSRSFPFFPSLPLFFDGSEVKRSDTMCNEYRLARESDVSCPFNKRHGISKFCVCVCFLFILLFPFCHTYYCLPLKMYPTVMCGTLS